MSKTVKDFRQILRKEDINYAREDVRDKKIRFAETRSFRFATGRIENHEMWRELYFTYKPSKQKTK
jgi:hypothetical protein